MRSSRVDVDTQGSGRCSTLRASFCVRAVSFIARMEHVWVFGSLWVLRDSDKQSWRQESRACAPRQEE